MGFGGTAMLGYGMYPGNSTGYCYGGNGYNASGYFSSGSNNGNANPPIGQAAAGGNNALAKLNPFQLTKQQAPAPDAQDSAPLDLPSRDWTNETGDAIVEGKFVGLLDGKVIVRKSSGGISLVALEQLSADDQQYVASVAGHKAAPAAAASE